MRTPGLSVEEVFKRVRISVLGKTQGQQTPWESSSLTGDFYFIDADKATAAAAGRQAATPTDQPSFDLAFWDSIKNSTNPEDFRAYLREYPNGRFASLARIRVNQPASSPSPASTPAGAPSNDGSVGAKGNSTADELKARVAEVEEQNRKITRDNETVSRAFRAGNDAFSAQNFDEAIRQYDAGLTVRPEEVALLTNKSVALRLRGAARFNSGLRGKDAALKSQGAQDLRAAADEAAKAVSLSDRQIKVDPSYSAQNHLAAHAQHFEALRIVAIYVDPGQAESAYKAFEDYGQVEKDRAKVEKARLQVAFMLSEAGSYERAATTFKAVLESDPGNLEAMYGCGMALINAGEQRAGVQYLTRFVNLAPDTHPRKADAVSILNGLK
jgi:tetratricopeptide (TPR) repeat protein